MVDLLLTVRGSTVGAVILNRPALVPGEKKSG